jgi:hypothetical protein
MRSYIGGVMVSTTSGTGRGGITWAPEFTPNIRGIRVTRSLVFYVVLSSSFSLCPSSIGHFIACLSLSFFYWPLYCLSLFVLLLAIALPVSLCPSIGHCIACLSLSFYWSLYCLSLFVLLLAIVLPVLIRLMASEYNNPLVSSNYS